METTFSPAVIATNYYVRIVYRNADSAGRHAVLVSKKRCILQGKKEKKHFLYIIYQSGIIAGHSSQSEFDTHSYESFCVSGVVQFIHAMSSGVSSYGVSCGMGVSG